MSLHGKIMIFCQRGVTCDVTSVSLTWVATRLCYNKYRATVHSDVEIQSSPVGNMKSVSHPVEVIRSNMTDCNLGEIPSLSSLLSLLSLANILSIVCIEIMFLITMAQIYYFLGNLLGPKEKT